MFGIENLGAFILAGVLLNITPGSDTMYILGRSIAGGKKAGVLSALGIASGSLIHTLLAALGLSVLLAESQFAFDTVKYLGATYLIYLGITAFLKKSEKMADLQGTVKKNSHRNIYLAGILTNVLNPKVALFYLAFLPQFIDPTYPTPFITFVILGLVFTFNGTIWCLILAIFSSELSDKIRSNYRIKQWLDRLTGMVFIGLGIKLALSEK